MSRTFQLWMKSIQGEVEVSLQEYLPSVQATPQRLHEAMAYAVLDGGKRVRPLLVFAAGKLFNAPQELLSRAACAVEMIHAYSLVHDDMPCMDDDALRRGKPTVHKKYDEATALLVGDALQAQAFLVLSESEANADQKLPMIQLLAQASGSVGMCGGQAIDLASVGLSLTREQLEQMHRLKTGALLRASVILGAMSGKRLETNEIAALDAYSAAVGLAFQVVDDVLDATADSATLGKTAGKDAADNKPTYVSLLGLEASQQLAQQLCQDAHQALAIFGESAQHLHDLADLIVQRKA
ncbi:polyprenyl synthetase family protein [Undibacterium sp. LX40W]|uniref:Polyprenyl synthetase family protein n=1 Tax=Undibacterium nitidum TaxID=2762298 RepID=A0A923HPA9_9BURK|nr:MULTISPECIES: farnesyl diphosphate synthase [Undibacterium]MBC3881393.1 polyprenyl synthetase family protein [Undibacterium nitidum]MBC3891824.1 polyprenyl synthetase family protein [Undibacterium sp. LX40W]